MIRTRTMQVGALLGMVAFAGLPSNADDASSHGEPKPKHMSPIVGHRGLIHHAPENTLATFGACIDLRIGFELDVRRSKDGRLVCIHDTTVDRTTDGMGDVRKHTFDQLRKLDAGRWFDPAFAQQRIPTLDEVFALLKSRRVNSILVAVDIKADDTKVETDIVRSAVKFGVLDQLLFIGRTITEPEVRKRLRKASEETHVAVLAQIANDLQKAIDDKNADWVYVRTNSGAGSHDA